MKKITLLALLFGSIIFSNAQEKVKNFGKGIHSQNVSPSGLIRCSADENEEILQRNNPKRMTRDQFNTFISPYVQQYLNTPSNASQSGGIIYIPVVVHVIHNGDAYGVDENITDEQVQSQMTVMTQDFRRMMGTPGFNNNPIGADIQIEFVLAKADPNGNPTNGINHVNLCKDNYNVGNFQAIQAEIDTNVKPQTIWDPTQYMNMWSVKWDGSGLLGYAQFPSNGTTTANSDGVVAGHTFFGSRTIYPAGNYSGTQYDKGRTMTHEVGHFLGLAHTFQGGCTGAGDNCADTPAVGTANYGCVAGTDSCPAATGLDMIENYMDYTDDSCMNIFTANQKAIVVSVMNTFPRRSTLKTSTKDIAIPLFSNDAEVQIENSCGSAIATCATPNPASPAKQVLLYNRGTSNLTAATLSYNFNGGGALTQNWTGNLAPNKFALVTLANSSVNGLLSVTVTAANGGADQRTTNNTATKSFGSGLAYANATTFTFNLVGDSFGSETTWTLENATGTTLYSGGPYTDIASGTQTLVNNATWTLPANGCYYLTVNDSWGDGLFDGTSQGNYTVTAGPTTVVNVPDFVASGNPDNTLISRVSYFTNNSALSTDEFALIDDVVLYPNPSKDFFAIDVPQSILRAGKIEIYNSLGQSVLIKNISSDTDLNVNVSNLTNGVYFLNLNLGEATKTLRFIKE
jgi:Pregnancy-associated plasma protein-A/Secretion system C-terminal sorting domain